MEENPGAGCWAGISVDRRGGYKHNPVERNPRNEAARAVFCSSSPTLAASASSGVGRALAMDFAAANPG